MLIGGERQLFFRAGTAVPGVTADANTTGYYLLTVDELDGMMNP